jgi:hypothetical protein
MDNDFMLFTFQESLSVCRAWTSLSQTDKERYMRLRSKFLAAFQESKSRGKGLSDSAFCSEVQAVINFTESSDTNREERSIVAGLACCGPYVAVNNRQLKRLTGRCKSSINGSFQQIGYSGIRAAAKSRESVLSLVPSLRTDAGALRQWTARFSDNPVLTTPDRPPEFESGQSSGDTVKSDEYVDAGGEEVTRRPNERDPIRFWDELFLKDDQLSSFVARDQRAASDADDEKKDKIDKSGDQIAGSLVA